MDWLDESRLVGAVAVIALVRYGWKFYGWLWESKERMREDSVRACRAGCVNIARDDDFLGSGFLVRGIDIDELRQRLCQKYEKYEFNYLIVTNYHVVEAVVTSQTSIEDFMLDGQNSIHISPAESSSITGNSGKFSARVVAYDEASDLALLTMVFQDADDASQAQDLTGFKTGLYFDPIKPQLLDTVYAFGCPQKYQSSVTKGIISHTSREIENKIYYQTDAAINHGNSGGPLINNQAFVVGVATIKLENEMTSRPGEHVENISFAIPAYRVIKFLQKLENSTLGAEETDVTDGMANFYSTIEENVLHKTNLVRKLKDFYTNMFPETNTQSINIEIMDEMINEFNLTNVATIQLENYLGNAWQLFGSYWNVVGLIQRSADEPNPITEPQVLVVYEVHDGTAWQRLTTTTWEQLLSGQVSQFRCFNERSIEDIERSRHYIITATKR